MGVDLNKAAIGCVVLSLSVACLGTGCTSVSAPRGFITAVGTELKDRAEDGETIVLKGVNEPEGQRGGLSSAETDIIRRHTM